MNKNETKDLLEKVAEGTLSVNEALLLLKGAPFRDIGFAKIDGHRALIEEIEDVAPELDRESSWPDMLTASGVVRLRRFVMLTRMRNW